MADLLQVRDLKTYFYTSQGVVKAVDGVSYDIQEGETVALVGESGCGKTMSALSIMRLVPRPQGKIEDGEILFQGRNLLALDEEEMRKIRGAEIAMIFQEPMSSLNPVLTIGRQITETLEAHHPVSGEEAKRRALDLLRLVGIPDPAQRFSDYPHQLSGGMRQRVMIAIAVSCGPKLILADEPTTALDVTIQAQILELLRGLSQEFGLAMIIITHNLGVVARYADRVHVMYAGKIIESASAREIYQNPRHPYTLGLLHSVPRLDQPRRAKLDPIEGQPPDLWNLPEGCSFAPRCKFVAERCVREAPPLRDLENHHRSACWVAENLVNR
ncbi:MAG: peptide ABC transporter ATP-binding protein [Deltaproteobacteria bacterium RIFCSPHIGHO2_02_FULL_60_17]|nr:MAG: peptide ABC transporter ATP-binding protein [Deltaproteobacteria bacterium RIFCSPHIGHO2_02_FULL_60_17]